MNTHFFPLKQHYSHIEKLSLGRATTKLDLTNAHLRSGHIVNGPTLFALCDITLFFAVLTHIGFEPMAVTSDLNIRFLRARPHLKQLICTAEIINLGKQLITGRIQIWGLPGEILINDATGSYIVKQDIKP
ncbi:MAG: PaaI family thioesterase [Pseudomonadota bacterium]